MASRALMYLSLVLGILYLPWWAVAAVAVAALALWSSYAVVFLAGIVMDLSYGAPVAALGDFSFVLPHSLRFSPSWHCFWIRRYSNNPPIRFFVPPALLFEVRVCSASWEKNGAIRRLNRTRF
jgi:hypothetical protein